MRNRVYHVQEKLPQALWNFIPGTENPADLATRGLTPSKLSELPSWWVRPTAFGCGRIMAKSFPFPFS